MSENLEKSGIASAPRSAHRACLHQKFAKNGLTTESFIRKKCSPTLPAPN
eukprot:gene20469-7454_t